MEEVFLTSSDRETKELAKKTIDSLTSGTVIALTGPMAAGKTTFTQGVGEVLGISRVVSPTYLIMREYSIEGHKFLKRLFHLDLYRISSVEEIRSFDLDEIWNQPENLVLIEWPEIEKSVLPKKRIDITIKSTGSDQREITIGKK